MNDTRGVFFVFSLVCLSLFFYGCFVTINSINNEKNECRMTFMFEHPNYVVSLMLRIRINMIHPYFCSACVGKDPVEPELNSNLDSKLFKVQLQF